MEYLLGFDLVEDLLEVLTTEGKYRDLEMPS